MEYIPDGLTKAQWAKIKEKEASKKVLLSRNSVLHLSLVYHATWRLLFFLYALVPFPLQIGKFDGLSGAKFRSRSMHDYMVGRAAGELKPNMVSSLVYFTAPGQPFTIALMCLSL